MTDHEGDRCYYLSQIVPLSIMLILSYEIGPKQFKLLLEIKRICTLTTLTVYNVIFILIM